MSEEQNTENSLESTDLTEEEQTLCENLETAHKRIFVWRFKDHGLVVQRKPTRHEWRRYKTDLTKAPMTDPILVQENLIKACMVHPGPQILDKILDDSPAMLELFMATAEGLAVGDRGEVSALGKDWKKPDATT